MTEKLTWAPDRPHILDETDNTDLRKIESLRADSSITIIDTLSLQLRALSEVKPPVSEDDLAEPSRWVYYPWRQTMVHVLGPRSFRRLRTDRNRNMITADEQARLGELHIGVVGLSVGHVVAHTLAATGCGRLRLADFDTLELSNLNRVPATVFDLGENKAVVAARRITELDPYSDVELVPTGLTPETIDSFLDGLDIVVEECDSLDVKALLRRAARAHRLPVLMATSDRGMVDVERYDLEPDRPILHGLLDEDQIDSLAGLSASGKVSHVLRIIEPERVSARAAASMVEVGESISTWPQLAGDVVLGAAAVAEAVRRIGLGVPLRSGRVRIDIGAALDELAEPPIPNSPGPFPMPAAPVPTTAVELIAEATLRAPSAGNCQPWRIEADTTSIDISVDPQFSASVDIGYRGSAVAIGAAVFNAQVAAAKQRLLGPVEWTTDDPETPLRAVLHFADGTGDELAELYEPLLERGTNRRGGDGRPMDRAVLDALCDAARSQDATLHMFTGREDLLAVADILARTDRIRYLTSHLHAELLEELRWPGDADPDAGLDINSLELDSAETAALQILQRSDAMEFLAEWDAGAGLGNMTRDRVMSSSAVGVLTVAGDSLLDYARGGAAAEAVWLHATRLGLAVHPVTPLFIYALDEHERTQLSPNFATALGTLAQAFDDLIHVERNEVATIVFRFGYAAPASVRSRRRAQLSSH